MGTDGHTGLWLDLTLSQATSANWAGASPDFVMATTSLRVVEIAKSSDVTVRLDLHARLGCAHVTDTTGAPRLRITDNEAFAEIVVSHELGWRANPFLSASIRTPITESHTYRPGSRQRIARLWDPVTTLQAGGFTLDSRTPSALLALRAGIAFTETRAYNHTALTDDPRTRPIERYRVDSGIQLVGDASLQLDSLINFTGRISLDGSFDDLSVWSLRSENRLRLKVWRMFAVTIEASVLHDIRQSRRTQIRQSLSLGLAGHL